MGSRLPLLPHSAIREVPVSPVWPGVLVEPPQGIEPWTPSLPWKCSTTELRRHGQCSSTLAERGWKSSGEKFMVFHAAIFPKR